MNMKLKKVLDEIQKTEERITEWQEHLRELNIRKKQLEDAEIIKSIRSMKLNSRELLVVLDKIQNGTAVFPYLTEETTVPDTKKEEDWKNRRRQRKHLFLFRGTEVWQMINQGTAQKSSLRYRQRTAIRFFLCWTVPVTKKTYICFP